MTNRLPLLALLVAPLSLGPCLAACQAPAVPPAARPAAAGPGAVSGLVARQDGDRFVPVAGAVVRLEGVSGHAVTDAEGRYALTGVPAGARRLTVEAEGFLAASRLVAPSPVAPVAGVNVALAPKRYAVAQSASVTAVSGVITDPRGAALPGATVRLSCPRANGGAGASLNLTSDANGFYAAALLNVLPDGASPANVEVTATGTSPGGVSLSASAPAAAPVGGSALVLDCTADSFPALSTPSVSGASLVLAGDEASIRVANVSQRPDEFYIQLRSGAQTFDVLPVSVAGDLVTFRVPNALPDAAFDVGVVPFGQSTKISQPSPGFISVDYKQADFDADVSYPVNSDLQDVTAPTGVLNGALFIGGDQARYTLTVANASTLMAHDLEIKGTVTPGTVIASATAGGMAIPAGNIVQPNAAGAWTLRNVNVPAGGSTPIAVTFTSPSKLANDEAFRVSGLSVGKPSLGLVKTQAPADSPTLVARSLDVNAIALDKLFVDDATPANGIAQIRLIVTPTGSGALGGIKITDTTKTEIAGTSTAASFTGTTTLPASGTPLGLTTSDKLDLKIDGGATLTVQVFSASLDAESLIGQINTTAGLSGNIAASRTGTNRLYLERVAQGSTRTLEILSSSTPNMLSKLGLTPGVKASGYLGDFTGATATQPGGTVWTITGTSTTWTSTTGTAVSTFTIRPPAAYAAGDGPTRPITITYTMRKYNGTAATLGGTGTGFGPRFVNFNLVAPYTSTAMDQTLTKAGNEPAAVSNL